MCFNTLPNIQLETVLAGSRLGWPILSSAPRRGGEGDPPLCIGKQEVGTYIYSRTYTVHGALGNFFEVLRLLHVVGESVDLFCWLKKPPALPFAAFHHPPWDFGIVFAYGLTLP
jgi:hypothetical protein